MLGLQNIVITPAMLNLVCEIDTFKGAWAAMENHTTSLQLLGDVSSFGRNFKEITKAWQTKPLDEDMLKLLHGLFQGKKAPSSYKDGAGPLVVRDGEDVIGELHTASPEEVAAIMPRLIKWAEDAFEKKDLHPLLIIAVFTAVFLQLCPFEKGNQKLARLLVILLMFKAGYSYAPYSTLDSLLAARGQDYYKALKHTQDTLAEGKVDWSVWLMFFMGLLRDQKNVLQKRLEKDSKEIVGMPALSTKILKLFEETDRISMKEIERLTRGKRSTLKLRLGELVEGGYLVRHGKARATWYSKV
ncbi:MAG: Fic family protein [Alphaproteobacteria bacterium]|nr:Fic family protein [Alphaproteobacteria bacterium]